MGHYVMDGFRVSEAAVPRGLPLVVATRLRRHKCLDAYGSMTLQGSRVELGCVGCVAKVAKLAKVSGFLSERRRADIRAKRPNPPLQDAIIAQVERKNGTYVPFLFRF